MRKEHLEKERVRSGQPVIPDDAVVDWLAANGYILNFGTRRTVKIKFHAPSDEIQSLTRKLKELGDLLERINSQDQGKHDPFLLSVPSKSKDLAE